MACCGGKANVGSPEEQTQNKNIEQMLTQEKRRLEREIKLLLLGAGESGKSTIAKQMKILHLKGFSDQERLSYKSIIFNNTIGSMRVLIAAAAKLGIQLEPQNRGTASNVASDEYFHGTITPQIAGDIRALWQDSGIKETFSRSSQFQLNDSAQYYFEAIERLAEPGYIPNEQDVLRSRAKTTGIIETEFSVDKTNFRMVDVGGQRSERKKWIHCFQDVTAVIFCVALSEYDLVLDEDETTNRMHESLKLFKEICNTKWFTSTAMILFLNKKDIFAEKIKKVDLNVCFKEYTDGLDYNKAVKYIQEQFLLQNSNPNKQIFTHQTCATDTDNIFVVWKAVKSIVLEQTMKAIGLSY